jgi:hypothetical protein
MWAAFLCTFPPLIDDTEISLERSGLVLNQSFEAPVGKSYSLYLNFVFPSVEARLHDVIVGDRYRPECIELKRYDDIPEKIRIGLGRPIPLRVVVRKSEDKSVILEQTFQSWCSAWHAGSTKGRIVGFVSLEHGAYTIEVFNEQVQTGLSEIKTYIGLVSGGHK